MYVHIYTCIHLHTYIHVCMYVGMHTSIYIMYIYIYTDIHMYICVYIYIYIYIWHLPLVTHQCECPVYVCIYVLVISPQPNRWIFSHMYIRQRVISVFRACSAPAGRSQPQESLCALLAALASTWEMLLDSQKLARALVWVSMVIVMYTCMCFDMCMSEQFLYMWWNHQKWHTCFLNCNKEDYLLSPCICDHVV